MSPIKVNLPFCISMLWFVGALYKSDLSNLDMQSHVHMISFYQQYLWPAYHGVDITAGLGQIIGYQYPSAMHWLGGMLSIFFPSDALRLILFLSIILIYRSLQKVTAAISQSKEETSWILFWLLAFFIGFAEFDSGIGGVLSSTLTTGLVTEAMGMPFYFFLIASCLGPRSQKKTVAEKTFFLSAAILTHAYVGLAAALFFLVHLILERDKKDYLVVLLSAVATSCWWVPYLANISSFGGHTRTELNSIYPASKEALALIAFLSTVAIVQLSQRKSHLSVPEKKIIFSCLSYASLFVILELAFTYARGFNTPIHTYRLYVFIITLLIVVSSKATWPTLQVLLSHKIRRFASWGICIFFCFCTILYLKPFTKDVRLIFNFQTDKGNLTRGLVLSSYTANICPDLRCAHLISDTIRQQKIPIFNILFHESNYLQTRALEAFQFVYPKLFAWHTNYKNRFDQVSDFDVFKVFGIDWVLSDSKSDRIQKYAIKNELVNAQVDLSYENKNLELHHYSLKNNLVDLVGSDSFVVIKNQSPRQLDNIFLFETDWKKYILSEDLPSDNKQNTKPKKENDLKLHVINPMKFIVDLYTGSNSLYVIKILFHKNWQAWDEYGRQIEVIRVSPGFLGIFAHGKITLEFIEAKYEKILTYLSIATMCMLLILMSCQRLRAK